MKPVREYKPGEKITITERVEDERRKTKKQKKTLTVIKQYPHFVLAEDKMGNKRSITNAELYMMAMEHTKTEDGAPLVADASGHIIGRGEEEIENMRKKIREATAWIAVVMVWAVLWPDTIGFGSILALVLAGLVAWIVNVAVKVVEVFPYRWKLLNQPVIGLVLAILIMEAESFLPIMAAGAIVPGMYVRCGACFMMSLQIMGLRVLMDA